MLNDLIQQVSADTALAICELSVLQANGASEELVLTKKYFILRDMLIERQCTQEMVGNLQYLFDKYESQYVPRIIETGKFSENLLYHAMLNATLYWKPNFHLLAYLINDGNDVVGAVHDIVNHQPHISQYEGWHTNRKIYTPSIIVKLPTLCSPCESWFSLNM